jgi:hypothetical protein
MKTKAIVLSVVIGAAVLVSVAVGAPTVTGAVATDSAVTGAAAGTFPSDTSYAKITISGWTMGVGVVIRSNGSALGDFELTADWGSTTTRRVTVVGKAERGAVKKDGGALFSGTALVNKGDGSAATRLPFSVYATSKGTIQLTLGNTSLPSVKLDAGSIFVG